MLAIPLKRAEQSGVAEALQRFLRSQFEAAELQKFSADVTTFDNTRRLAAAVVEATEDSKAALLRYHTHLAAVLPRLGGYENDLKLQFGWGDAFKPTRRTASTSFYYDWGAMLFNLGALESYQGAIANRSSDEGIRVACKHFQQAAGIFQYINENITPRIIGAVSTDISSEGLTMTVELMLGQAQACFYEMAVKERKAGKQKASVVAKLAAQCSTYYSSARIRSTTGQLAGILDRSWASHMEFQAKCFQGAAEYWQSVAVHEQAMRTGQGYGEEIARLQRSQACLTEAIAIGTRNHLQEVITSTAQTLLRTVQRDKDTAERDNRTIYIENIPAESQLQDVVGVAMVRPYPMPTGNTERPLFSDLLPKAVRDLRSRYSDAAHNIFTAVEAEATTATNEGRVVLSSMGLPGSLEAYKSGGGVPENLWKKVKRTQDMGGVRALEDRMQDLNSAAERANQSASHIETSLRREENLDSDFRLRNPSWTGVPSASLNQDIKSNLDRLKGLWAQARESDNSITSQLHDPTFRRNSEDIAKSKEQLDALMPRVESQDPTNIVNTATLEGLLVELAQIFERRIKLVGEARTIAELDLSSTFLAAVTRDPRAGEDALRTELQRLEFHRTQINETIARQAALLSQVTEENEIFNRARATDPITTKRDDVVKTLEQTSTTFFNLHSQLSAGVTFYADLQKRLTVLLQGSDDLCYTQQLQRNEFELSLQRSYERSSQEEKDREYAMTLMQENETKMEGVNLNEGNIAYGQPISAPPPRAVPSTTATPSISPGPVTGPYSTNPNPVAQSLYQQYPPNLHQYPPNPLPYAPQSQPQPQYVPSNPPPSVYTHPSAPHLAPLPSQYPGAAYHHGYQTQPQTQYPTMPPQPYNQASPYAQPYGGVPQQYSTQPHGYATGVPVAPPQSTTYAPPTMGYASYPPQTQAPSDPKVSRLCEMGFERGRVMTLLAANNGDEQATLEALLRTA